MGGLMHGLEPTALWTMPSPDKRNPSSAHRASQEPDRVVITAWTRSSLPGPSFSRPSPSMHPCLTQPWEETQVRAQGILITRLARRSRGPAKTQVSTTSAGQMQDDRIIYPRFCAIILQCSFRYTSRVVLPQSANHSINPNSTLVNCTIRQSTHVVFFFFFAWEKD